MIQFYRQHEKKDASIEEIRKWKNVIGRGLRPSSLAKAISEGKKKEDPSMDLDL